MSEPTPSNKQEKVKLRSSNFQVDEDVDLCRAFVNVSQDPNFGNDRKADDFWKIVLERYNTLRKQEVDVVVERDYKSIKNRFQRHIGKGVQEWNPYFRRIKLDMPSGTPESEYMQIASERFRNTLGKSFNFEHCVEILHDMPKFNPMSVEHNEDEDYDDDDDDDGKESRKSNNQPVNNTTMAMGSNFTRPIGCKRAKTTASDDLYDRAMEKMASSAESPSRAIEKKNLLMEKQMKMDRLLKLIEIYLHQGKDDKVNELTRRLEAMEEEGN
jgi:hypothetical protein